MKTPPSEEAPPLKLPPPPKFIWRRCLGVFHHKNSSSGDLRRSSHVSVMKNTSSSWLKINRVKSILVLVLLSILTSETWFHRIFMTKTLYLQEYQIFLKTDSPRSFSHSKPRITKTKTCFHVYVSIYVCLRQSKITTRTCIHVHVRLWVSLSFWSEVIFENWLVTIFFPFKIENNQNQNMFSCTGEHISLFEKIKNPNRNMFSCTHKSMKVQQFVLIANWSRTLLPFCYWK